MYEYRLHRVHALDLRLDFHEKHYREIEDEFNEFSRQGWDVVTLVHTGRECIALLRRPAPDE